ncbi:MAG: hypothetical protein CMN78_01065 [Spirochaetales bacterium]|nr:hypothetical protein [Spirochaetales bacterium]
MCQLAQPLYAEVLRRPFMLTMPLSDVGVPVLFRHCQESVNLHSIYGITDFIDKRTLLAGCSLHVRPSV